MKYTDLCNAVQNEIAQVLNSIDENKLNKFVEMITKDNVKILGYSAGRMGFGLKAFLMRLNHLGIAAYWLGDNYVPPMNENDVFICCSNSGTTASVFNILEIFKNKAKGHIVPDRDILKTKEQIEMIRKSAELNTAVLDHVAANIKAGMSTADIDRLVHDFTVAHGGIPAPLGYEGFPKSVCTSINNVVCHGIPDENEILEEGDIINVDVSTILNGYFSDASRMFMIGQVDEEAEKLVKATKECLDIAVKNIKPFDCVGDIGYYVSKHAKANGYSVVKE